MEKEKKNKCHIIAVLTAQERENLSQLQWYWLAKKKEKVTLKQTIAYSLNVAHNLLIKPKKSHEKTKN